MQRRAENEDGRLTDKQTYRNMYRQKKGQIGTPRERQTLKDRMIERNRDRQADRFVHIDYSLFHKAKHAELFSSY